MIFQVDEEYTMGVSPIRIGISQQKIRIQLSNIRELWGASSARIMVIVCIRMIYTIWLFNIAMENPS
jgi:hypothetical protein